MLWCCLALACVGASWFSFQYFLVPQPHSFAPDWQDAQWVQATDAANPVAYFRLATTFVGQPDSAFVTVTATQVFDLNVNGYDIGTNAGDFVKGDVARTYMYDITSAAQPATNVIGLRVTNVDNQIPQVRANVGAVWGNTLRYYGTGTNWQATGQSALTYPRHVTGANNVNWSTPSFDATQWRSASLVASPPSSPTVFVNPLVYEQPMPSHWLSAGYSQEGYYVRQVTLPGGFDQALLRVVASGEADIFINGHLAMKWVSQVAIPKQTIAYSLSENAIPAIYEKGLLLGAYDISPFLRPGKNTIAIHVLSPGMGTSLVGLTTQQGAMSSDMLLTADGHTQELLGTDSGWHAATRPVSNWTSEGSSALSWPTPLPVGRPGQTGTYYLPLSNTTYNTQYMPGGLLLPVIVGSVAAVLLGWLLFALLVLRRYTRTKRAALELAALVFMPALACEALLLSLSHEPLLARPFPYTMPCALLLLALVFGSAALLWLYTWRRSQSGVAAPGFAWSAAWMHRPAWTTHGRGYRSQGRISLWRARMLEVLARHWLLLPLLVLGVPMICYDPGYEPYWQDELSSFQAARGILAHGVPVFPSGVLYPKAELFSYMLALLIAIFGSGHIVPRLISMAEYIVSIPLIYAIGYTLFKKRSIAWLAAAMLTFSPDILLWGRQARMYEQALVMVMLTMFLFYRALQQRERPRPIYLAVLCLALTYFSHEESFIILPAVVICVLLESREGPYRIPAVLRLKHWWFAAIAGAAVIAAQLAVVSLFHPILLGTDQSVRPQIQISTDNLAYYFHQLFMPTPVKDAAVPWSDIQTWLTVNSVLAVLGCLWAWRSRDRHARYCALFLLLSLLTLVFVFTMQATRYFYPLLPVYYLMGSYALYKLLRVTWLFARSSLAHIHTSLFGISASQERAQLLPVMIAAKIAAAVLCICALLLPMLPISSYNLLVSRAFGLSYHRHFPDYDNAAAYIHSHWQKGDIVITIAPAVSILYYVGQADYYFSVDRALFVIEKNGQMAETTSGVHPLLNQADFQAVLSAHARIWLISDNGSYQAAVVKNTRFTFPPPDFRLVFEGYGSAVFFRSSLQ